MITAELMNTEKNYVNNMRSLIRNYKKPIENSSKKVLSNKKVDFLFGNIESVLNLNSKLLNNWENCKEVDENKTMRFLDYLNNMVRRKLFSL